MIPKYGNVEFSTQEAKNVYMKELAEFRKEAKRFEEYADDPEVFTYLVMAATRLRIAAAG